jgi:hypothetical protein
LFILVQNGPDQKCSALKYIIELLFFI